MGVMIAIKMPELIFHLVARLSSKSRQRNGTIARLDASKSFSSSTNSHQCVASYDSCLTTHLIVFFAQGSCFFLPKGAFIYNTLVEFIRVRVNLI